jgi:integrase
MHPVAVSPKQSPQRSTKGRSRTEKPRTISEGAVRHYRVDLRSASIAQGTKKNYWRAVLRFLDYVIAADEHPSTNAQFDDVLLDWIQSLYEHGNGVGKSIAKNAIHGLCHIMPSLRGHLVKSGQAISGWNKLHQGRSYPPLTWELASLLAVEMRRSNPTSGCRYAVATVLAFDCLLRVSELVNLKREDIAFEDDPRVGVRPKSKKGEGEQNLGAIVVIRRAKTGKNQSVTLRDPQIIALMREMVQSTRPNSYLFPFTAAQYRRTFKRNCAALHLSSLYVPHSLRHGGATRYRHRLGWSMEDVMQRGRWQSSKSARIYIQAGVALAMSMQVPRGLNERGGRYSLVLYDLLSPLRRVRGENRIIR